MLILASSSATRAKILSDSNIDFKQIFMDYNENIVSKNLAPFVYVGQVVKAKKQQFFKKYPSTTNVLIADSIVVCNDNILGKAKDELEARNMLLIQSQNVVKIITAMSFIKANLELFNINSTTYKFDKFEKNDLETYIKSKDWQGKAGAMMIEGFNKKYILSQNGYTSTAMGLSVEILKVFL